MQQSWAMFMMVTQWPSGAVAQVKLSGLLNVLVHLHCITFVWVSSHIALLA